MVHVPGERGERPRRLLDKPSRSEVFPPASSTTGCLPTCLPETFIPCGPHPHHQIFPPAAGLLLFHLPEVNFLSLELKKSQYGEITMGKMGTCRR